MPTALLVALASLPITHDAIWQVWIGRQLLHGADLYVDIIEVNPPLWFWMAIPLAAICQLLAIEPRMIVIGFFFAAIALSLWLSPARFKLLLAATLILLPLLDFGQREHFTLIAVAPYVFLISRRLDGLPCRRAAMIGVFAAFGLALKPWFVLVPIALECLLWAKGRRSIVRPELIALAVAAAVYAVAVLAFAPSYLSDIVPVVRRVYAAFKGPPQLTWLYAPLALACLGALIGRRRGSSLTLALGVAALAFVPAVIMQGKGWSYQMIPARGFLFLALAIALWKVRRNANADSFLAAAALLCFLPLGVYRNHFQAEMEQHLAGTVPGSSIIVLSSNPMTAWPMVDDHHLQWKLRAFSLWMLPAVAFGQAPELEPGLRRMVVEDLKSKPDILVIDRHPLLGPATRALIPAGYLNNYSLVRTTPRFESWQKSPSTLTDRVR